MGAKTPKNIRAKVLKLWLLGLKRDEVAHRAGVSLGNVLNIIEKSKKEIPDINLLRKVAVEIRKKGWTWMNLLRRCGIEISYIPYH